MKTRTAIAFSLILTASGILPAAEAGSDMPVAPDPASAYDTWEMANGITGAGADADSDGDGISNGIEFVIGGDPSGPGSDSNSLLPMVTVDMDYLILKYRRTDAAAGYDPFVEYSRSLGDWIEAQGGVDGVVTEDALEFEPGVALVTVKIPRALATPGNALFARLRVEITP